MVIQVGGKSYNVTESSTTWTVSIVAKESFSGVVKVSKKDCPTLEDLQKLLNEME